jgi:GntP family gluconate:H+ symporter
MLVPVLKCLDRDSRNHAALLYLAAVGSIISYILIYPTPAVIPLFTQFAAGMSAILYNAVAIPLSVVILCGTILCFRRAFPAALSESRGGNRHEAEGCPAGPAGAGAIHWRAWGPFIAILGAIPVSFLLLGLSNVGIMNFIMLAGAVTAIALAPHEIRSRGVTGGAKHAGVIIFDICGAGALGYVIVHSGFTTQALLQMTLFLPAILVPFVIAALIATAQGSRITTAVITSEVLAGSVVAGTIHPVTLILLAAAGSCLFSYVTDPFFWLVQRTTGDDVRTVARYYTLPLALAGIAIAVVAVALEYLVF